MSSAKTNAERQQAYRVKIMNDNNSIRLNTYISSKADDNLKIFMKKHNIKKREAVSLILEYFSEEISPPAKDNNKSNE